MRILQQQMSYRVNYCICPLHEEPLNYICLHANCQSDRVICAICLQERHSNAHHTLPLKLYLTNKLHKLKCLTESEDAQIESSLIQQKSQSLKQLDELGIEIFESLGNLKIQFESFYDSQLAALRACRELISKEVIEVEKLEQIEAAVQTAANFDEYSRAAAGQIEKIRADVIERIESLHPEEVLIDHSWVGHPELDINRSILISKSEKYKIAYLSKPLNKSCKINFRVLSSPKNWIAFGVCHSNVVQERGFAFRYHTIGHGIYAVSSNGGIWSHYKPEFNNKLGGPKFSAGEGVTVGYDGSQGKVSFQVQGESRVSMEVDPQESGWLHFCMVAYFEGDMAEAIFDLN